MEQVKRFDSRYTPPFRVGKKQGKAILDANGVEVVFFNHSEEQAKMYCDYLNKTPQIMKSGIKDKNGVEVKVGDTLVLPYITPLGELIEDTEGDKVEVIFKYGCFGYYEGSKFVALYYWQKQERGDHTLNEGYEYPFWVE